MEELLKQSNIPQKLWTLCKIENGIIYTPNMDILYENNLISEEEYEFYLSNKIGTCPQPDKMSIFEGRVDALEMMNAGLLFENAQQQIKLQEQEQVSAGLLFEVAMLKGGM